MIDSKVLYSGEVDDFEQTAEELFEQAQGFSFRRNTVGIIYIEDNTECEELYEALSSQWKFPMIGCTTIGLLMKEAGFVKGGVSMMLLTSDDCNFSVGMTQDLSVNRLEDEIRRTFDEAEKGLEGEEVKLVIALAAMMSKMSGDDILSAIDDLGMNVPVYGGLASDMFTFQSYQVFCNGRVSNKEQVFLLISGNVDPKILYVQSLSGKANFSYEVTRSEGNQVFQVGNTSFVDALERAGMKCEKDLVVPEYIQTPFITSVKKPDGQTVEALRNLTRLDHTNGSGYFLGGVMEGSSIEIGILNTEDVKSSVGEAFDEICNWLKEQKEYKTVFCFSCAARFIALGNNISAEADCYKGRIPEDVSLLGMYSFGEFAPVGEEKRYNVFHNSTFTIMCI